MPFTKILPADPQPDVPEAAYAVLLASGEWIAPDEIGVELDSGERLAASCVVTSRDYGAQSLTLLTSARVLTADGGTAADQGRDPAHVATQWSHTATLAQIERAGGLDALRRDCLRAVLGEPPLAIVDGAAVLLLPDVLLAQISIRSAIQAAAVIGAAIDNPDPL